MDILEAFPVVKMPPALLQTVAYGLDRVSKFVGDSWGQSFSASDTWKKRRGNIHKDTVAELRNLSEQHGYVGLEELIEGL